MAKILNDGEWYQQLAPESLYESEFENIVLQQAPILFPRHHLIQFRTLVYSDDDAAMPDMALIDKSYREWWIVEIEMGHHSLEEHLIPQIRTLSSGEYSHAKIKHLSRKTPALDRKMIAEMLKGKPPRVLVIANVEKPDWIVPLKRFDAQLMTFEVFRSADNRRLFRVSGDLPVADNGVASNCYLDPLIPGFLVIESPASIRLPLKGRITADFQGCRTEWNRLDVQNKVWLTPVGMNPLTEHVKYEISQQSGGTYEIRMKRHSKRRGT